MLKKIAIFSFLIVVFGYEVSGACNQSVPVIQNFNVANYAGLWYEMHRYEQDFELNMNCVTANYTPKGNVVEVVNKGVVNKKLVEIKGNATLVPGSTEGKLIVNFPGNTTTNSNYWILGTNYKSYSVVYSCVDRGSTSIVSSWILSREPHMLMNDTAKVVEIINKDKDLTGLDWIKYKHVSHNKDACDSASGTYSSFILIASLIAAKLFI